MNLCRHRSDPFKSCIRFLKGQTMLFETKTILLIGAAGIIGIIALMVPVWELVAAAGLVLLVVIASNTLE